MTKMSRSHSSANKIVGKLKALGQSAREIANQLGGGYTKALEDQAKSKKIEPGPPLYTMRAYEIVIWNRKTGKHGWFRRTGEDHKL